jgi:hypothetical protein
MNDRDADMGDAISEIAHPKPFVANVPQGIAVLPLFDQNRKVIGYYYDGGTAKAIPNAAQPKMEFPSSTIDIPKAATDFSAELFHKARLQARIASVATGDDDVSGGRITGTATGYRMWPTVAATQNNERVEFSQGFINLTNIVLRWLKEKGKALDSLEDVEPTKITDEYFKMEIVPVWHPAIPIEKTEENVMLNSDLQVGGISLETYLVRKGHKDPRAEAERIYKHLTRMAEIEATAQIKVAEMKAESDEKKLEMQGELNEQRLEQQDEVHQQRLQQGGEMFKQSNKQATVNKKPSGGEK